MTSAGRLSSTISQGSPSRSATRERPMTRPITEPSSHRERERHRDPRQRRAEIEGERAGARLVDDRERHRLRVRQQARAGELRAGVPGRDQQRERDEPRAKLIPRRRPVERAGRELARRADELGAADLGQHAVQARAHRPLPRRSGGARCLRRSAGGRSRAPAASLTPMRGASRCHSASEAARISLAWRAASRKRSTVAAVARGPGAVERVADDRDRRPWRRGSRMTSSIAMARLNPCSRARRRSSRTSAWRRSRPAAPSADSSGGAP